MSAGKSLGGALVFVSDSKPTDRKHKKEIFPQEFNFLS